ncbi:MAG: SMC-Scp complex subunit ScpB [Gammaproteobacteria bacterium]|nr:SMC-Scp complex subunit ScpB [Gammaproteobacteria bacterium]
MSTDSSVDNRLKNILEAALLAAGQPVTLDNLQDLFPEEDRPDKKDMRAVLAELQEDYQGRGVEVAEVGGGFRINVNQEYSPWVSKLWGERPAKYSKALLETLALIAYRQPVTRGEIEDIRGVSVSSSIIKTLLEREWVRVVGQRDVPGRPSLYATTREFLSYFSLKGLADLPSLAEIRDLDSINRELELDDPNIPQAAEQSEGGQTNPTDSPQADEDSEEGKDDDVALSPEPPAGADAQSIEEGSDDASQAGEGSVAVTEVNKRQDDE